MTKLELENLTNLPITDAQYTQLNVIMQDENEHTKDLFISYIVEFKHLIQTQECKSLIDFIRALKFITYTNNGFDNFEAYIKAFSDLDNIREYVLTSNLDLETKIKKSATLYAKSKFILKLTSAMDYPLTLLFNGYRYQAIEQLRQEMLNANLSKDRIAAADKLLVHLAPNLEQNNNIVNININQEKEKSPIQIYKEALEVFAKDKLKLIEQNPKLLNEIINMDATQNVKN